MVRNYNSPTLKYYGDLRSLTGKFGFSGIGDTEYTTNADGSPLERGFDGSQDTCEFDRTGNFTNPNCPL